ncbi:MAG TPA: heavy metal translocating P-type ATPase [Noviherbaspirillum sp.]|nr:heavy metal translocating P-type ATPase [Noviherbaspirillum sp.]
MQTSGTQRTQYRIQNMDCPTEERIIRNKLEGMPGIVQLDFNLMNRVLDVHHMLSSQDSVLAALKAIGMQAEPLQQDVLSSSDDVDAGTLTTAQKVLLGISGVTAAAAEALAWTTNSEVSPLVIVLAIISIATGGMPTLRKGWIALKTFTLNINFLMSLAAIGAIAIGQWPEASMVIFLFAVAELIESLSLNRARNAVHDLIQLAPDTAAMRGSDGKWVVVPTSSVPVGAQLRVKPGERIALDGVVVFGESSVNQAPITGESMPVDKRAGDTVYAGTINGQGVLDFKVSANSGESTLSHIVRVIEETQGNQAPTQRFVDKFARYYTPAVVATAVLVAVIPPLVFATPFAPWLYKALVMLVIACPCALVISTPVTVVSGLTAAARRGILIKGGEFLEAGYQLKAIAVDKTGTLTLGQPAVTAFKPLGGHSQQEVMLVAASLNHHSDHPLARAIVKAGPPESELKTVERFESLPGRGVKAQIGGVTYYLGNHRLLEELGRCSPQVETILDELEGQAQTAIILFSDQDVLGVIGIADILRPGVTEVIRDLGSLGVATVMLTGDNVKTADRISEQVGITEFKGELLPEDKLAEVKRMQVKYGHVGMVGDGVNDAPALAQAQIGFAMGAAGSDTAIETADVALMDDDLRKLPAFIRLSRETRRILIQNISAALGIKAVFFVLALAGLATLWMAVFADMGASLLVVFNGLRLLGRLREE